MTGLFRRNRDNPPMTSTHSALAPIRRATLADLAGLSALIEAAYRGPESLTGWTSEAAMLDGQRMSLDELSEAVTGAGRVMLLVEGDDGAPIGCAGLTRTEAGAEFGKFAVRPALQSGGLGKRLLAACEDWLARAWGGGLMTLTVIEGRPELRAYYERRGYQATGHTLALASVHDAPGWTRGRDLILEEMAKPIPALQST